MSITPVTNTFLNADLVSGVKIPNFVNQAEVKISYSGYYFSVVFNCIMDKMDNYAVFNFGGFLTDSSGVFTGLTQVTVRSVNNYTFIISTPDSGRIFQFNFEKNYAKSLNTYTVKKIAGTAIAGNINIFVLRCDNFFNRGNYFNDCSGIKTFPTLYLFDKLMTDSELTFAATDVDDGVGGVDNALFIDPFMKYGQPLSLNKGQNFIRLIDASDLTYFSFMMGGGSTQSGTLDSSGWVFLGIMENTTGTTITYGNAQTYVNAPGALSFTLTYGTGNVLTFYTRPSNVKIVGYWNKRNVTTSTPNFKIFRTSTHDSHSLRVQLFSCTL